MVGPLGGDTGEGGGEEQVVGTGAQRDGGEGGARGSKGGDK